MKLWLKGGADIAAKLYLRNAHHTADTFGQFAKRTRNEKRWRYFEIDASHSPNVTALKSADGVAGEDRGVAAGRSRRAGARTRVPQVVGLEI